MLCPPWVADRIAELDEEEARWQTQRDEIKEKIAQMKEDRDRWPAVRDELMAKIESLRAAKLCADNEKLLVADKDDASKSQSPDGNPLSQTLIVCPVPEDERQTEVAHPPPPPSPVLSPVCPPPSPKQEVPSPKTPTRGGGKTGRKGRGKLRSTAPVDKVGDDSVYKLKWSLTHHLDAVRSVAFHPTRPYMASASDDGTIRMMNLEPLGKTKARRAPSQFLSIRTHMGPVLSLAARNDVLFSGGADGRVCSWVFGVMEGSVYEVHERLDHSLLRQCSQHTDAVWSIAAHPDVDFCVTASADGTVLALVCDSFKTDVVNCGEAPTVVCFTLDGSQFAVGCQSGNMRMFSSQDKSALQVIECQSFVYSIAAGGVPSQMIIGLEDTHVKVYDVVSNEVTHDFVAHSQLTTGLAVSLQPACLVTTSSDTDVRMWKLETFDNVYASQHHRAKFGEAGLCVVATPQSSTYHYVASGGADGTVRVFGI